MSLAHLTLALLTSAVLPVHGTVLDPNHNGTVIIRNDTVTGMLPSQTRAYKLTPALSLSSGEGVDGFVDRSTTPWRWYDASVAGTFTPGMPDVGKVEPIDVGSSLPRTQLVDQQGRMVDLARDFSGKVTLVAFIFTRCPDRDECPVLTAKFGALAQQLDPARFHLIEVSLDPVYDSPAVLAEYGKQYGAHPDAWSFVTGQPSQIQHLLDRFGISSLRVSDDNFIHSDRVFIANEHGVVTDVVEGTGWSPTALEAQAKHVAGMVSSPLGRLELAIVASAVALCGGSQFAGIILLETVLFLVIAGIAFLGLGWVARQLWKGA